METLSVTELVRRLNLLLGTQVVSVEGEIQSFTVSQGRWVFFSLRDETSLVECFSFAWRLRVALEDGMRVRVLATPALHPRSGRFRLHVERVELVGEGALRRAFQLLCAKLEGQGLFSANRKRPLPAYPERIGLICSKESAAFTDFKRILDDRFGGLTILLAHVPVQGSAAPGAIDRAFTLLNALRPAPQLIVLTRGGGSLEDLQAFNTELVARAIFRSPVPVVSAVGHERDSTIADYVADVRAATPTNAAELIVPDRRDRQRELSATTGRLCRSVDSRLLARHHAVGVAATRCAGAVVRYRGQCQAVVRAAAVQVERFDRRLQAARAALVQQRQAMTRAMAAQHRARLVAVQRWSTLLTALDPQRLLARGYSIVRRHGAVVQSRAALVVGDALSVTFADGTVGARVTER